MPKGNQIGNRVYVFVYSIPIIVDKYELQMHVDSELLPSHAYNGSTLDDFSHLETSKCTFKKPK